jgi:hypothetical protein
MRQASLLLTLFSLAICAYGQSSGSRKNPLDIGLVAHYPLDGNAYDISGNKFNAIAFNAAPTFDRFGKPNSAMSFNGVNSYLQCGDILDDEFCAPVAKFSICGWAKTRASGALESGGGQIVGKAAGGTYGPYQWGVSHIEGSVFASVFSDTAAINYLTLTTPMTTNRWFHFVLVFDGSRPELERLKLYVDGQPFSVSITRQVGVLATTTANSAQCVTIGAGHHANNPLSPSNCYNGDVDDIRIYNRALSVSDIHSLYIARK